MRFLSTFLAAVHGAWTCGKCGNVNPPTTATCAKCGGF
jgi:hypothetical protein